MRACLLCAESHAEDSCPVAVGTTPFDGRYRILCRLENYPGVAYKATHQDEEVIICILDAQQARNRVKIERMRRESMFLRRIKNQHVVWASLLCELPDGRFYLLKEFADGALLSEALAQAPQHRLPADRACRIAAQVALGLQSAHDDGIVHRGLSPRNILLSNQQQHPDFVRLIDFGIARDNQLPPLTAPDEVLSDPRYLPPEYWLNNKMNPRGDQYMLGCVLYEMLTGLIPDSKQAFPGPPSRHVTDLPKDLDDVVVCMLSSRPKERYEKLSVVYQRLLQIHAQRPLRICCLSAPEDRKLFDELKLQLNPLSHQRLIEIWDAETIPPGQPRAAALTQALQETAVVLLLWSAHLAGHHSDLQAAEQWKQQTCGVLVPILLRPVIWPDSLEGVVPLPRNGVPVTLWKQRDQAWCHVVIEIKKLVAQLMNQVPCASVTGSAFAGTPR